ncbi:zinc finger protein [Theobroma cacao]|uniref:RING-type domain-containing protein n=1 Tax=Theobroma cacao TaxID=3641 RepID=A0A061DFR3_THECC|nr:Uncharacterized protein TCM_000202 [Theobroma cacao]WRX08425.1 zinc finger protein [Theobroma cacao]
MKPATNFSLSHKHLLRDYTPSPSNGHCRTVVVNHRIVVTTMAATISLCLIVLLICKCFHLSNRSRNPTNVNPRAPSIDDELASIPALVYAESTLWSSQPSCSDDDSLELEEHCAICLEGYVHGDSVSVLPRCKHMFHKKCIEEWLQVPSLHCPICRDQILERCLQSTRSNGRNQRDGIANPFPSLAFNLGGNYALYPSVLSNFT